MHKLIIGVIDLAMFFMPPPFGPEAFCFLWLSVRPSPSVRPSVRPSVSPKPEIPSFDLYMGPLVHPTNCDRFMACPSVRPERFPGICRRTHEGNSLKFYMLIYLDHLQNWLVYGHGLFIYLILALFWLSETGPISWRTHGENGLKCGMLLYPDHLQNWLDYGYGLVIFLILVLFQLS